MIEPYAVIRNIEPQVYDDQPISFLYIAATKEQRDATMKTFVDEFETNGYQLRTLSQKMMIVEYMHSDTTVTIYATTISEFDGLPMKAVGFDDILIDIQTPELNNLMISLWNETE